MKKAIILSLSLLVVSCGITPSFKMLTTEEKDQGLGEKYYQFWLKWRKDF